MSASNPACKPCARSVGRSVLARGARTFPPGLALLWPLSPSLVGVKKSAVGPDLTWSYTGPMYDGDGVSIGANPPFHAGKGVYGGHAVTNLMPGDSTVARTVTLTAQAYTLLVWSGSVSCSYGTATLGTPLKFTATAGSTVFTPTGVTKWMLVAGSWSVAPYVPPGGTQPSAAATTGDNGLNVLMDRKILDALGGKDGAPAVCTVMHEAFMGVGSGDLADGLLSNAIDCRNAIDSLAWLRHIAVNNSRIVSSFDGTNYAAINLEWSYSEIHRRYVQTNATGTKFRTGYERFNADMTPITNGIVWSHASAEVGATFDGSFNPLTRLRFGLNLTVPIWHRKCWISQKCLSDTQIQARNNLVRY